MMDMEKEGLGAAADEAIANAATANVNAAIEVASSAVTAFVDSLAGRKKTRGGKKRSSKTRAATVSKRGMAKASPKKRSTSVSQRAAKQPSRKSARPQAKNANQSSQELFHTGNGEGFIQKTVCHCHPKGSKATRA